MMSQLDPKAFHKATMAYYHYLDFYRPLTYAPLKGIQEFDEVWKMFLHEDIFSYNKCQDVWNEIDVHIVQQFWSNTSGGFESMDGAAITAAYTTIIENKRTGLVFVYYNGIPAYICKLDYKYKAYMGDEYVMLPGLSTAKKKLTLLHKFGK